MDSFRSSSDLVKIIWLLAPVLVIFSLAYMVSKLRKPVKPTTHPQPVFAFDTADFGRVEVYHTSKEVLMETFTELDKISHALAPPKKATNQALPDEDSRT